MNGFLLTLMFQESQRRDFVYLIVSSVSQNRMDINIESHTILFYVALVKNDRWLHSAKKPCQGRLFLKNTGFRNFTCNFSKSLDMDCTAEYFRSQNAPLRYGVKGLP